MCLTALFRRRGDSIAAAIFIDIERAGAASGTSGAAATF